MQLIAARPGVTGKVSDTTLQRWLFGSSYGAGTGATKLDLPLRDDVCIRRCERNSAKT